MSSNQCDPLNWQISTPIVVCIRPLVVCFVFSACGSETVMLIQLVLELNYSSHKVILGTDVILYLHKKYQLTSVYANKIAVYHKLQIVIMHYTLDIRAEDLSSFVIFFVRMLLLVKSYVYIFVLFFDKFLGSFLLF